MCDAIARRIILTYHLSHRNKIGLLLIKARDLGYEEVWELEDFLAKANVNTDLVRKNFPFTSSLVQVPEGDEFYAISRLYSLAEPGTLLSIEPNTTFSLATFGPVTKFSFKNSIRGFYLNMLNVPSAHRRNINGHKARIAILDSGVEGAGSSIGSGKNFINPGSAADDDNGHGTAVASIVHAVAPSAELIPIKIVDRHGHSDLWEIHAGILAANAEGAPITNISLTAGIRGGPCPRCGRIAGVGVRSFVLEEAVSKHSVTSCIISAAGNDGRPEICYPARCKGAIAIGSVNKSGARSHFSNYDLKRECFTAPGGDGTAKAPPTEYVGKNLVTGEKLIGTSFAAAYSSGVLALYWEKHGQVNFVDQALKFARTNSYLLSYS